MAKEIQCQQCKVKTPKNELTIHVHVTSTGTKKNMYFHGECLDKYFKDKEFKEAESKELDDLYIVMKEIHNIDVIPTTIFSMYLQPLRNGIFKSGTRTKKYKEGIPYSVMKDSYLYVKGSIEYTRKNKEFNSTTDFLRYTFAIMVDKMPMAKKKKKQEEFAKIIENENINIQQSHDDIAFAEREYKFKKKQKKGIDMSEFLD